MIAVEAEAAALVLVTMTSVNVMVLGEGGIHATMIEGEGLEAEALVGEVDVAEVLGRVEGEMQGKAVLREGQKLSSGIGKERMLNLVEIIMMNGPMKIKAMVNIMMNGPMKIIRNHLSKEMENMTTEAQEDFSVCFISLFDYSCLLYCVAFLSFC